MARESLLAREVVGVQGESGDEEEEAHGTKKKPGLVSTREEEVGLGGSGMGKLLCCVAS